jgi:hypothetical protein
MASTNVCYGYYWQFLQPLDHLSDWFDGGTPPCIGERRKKVKQKRLTVKQREAKIDEHHGIKTRLLHISETAVLNSFFQMTSKGLAKKKLSISCRILYLSFGQGDRPTTAITG